MWTLSKHFPQRSNVFGADVFAISGNRPCAALEEVALASNIPYLSYRVRLLVTLFLNFAC